MVKSLDSCKNINDFNDLVDINKVQVEIGKNGGRYFKILDNSYSMNEIVHKL